MPRPLRRSLRPSLEPAGTVSATLPLGVGTSMVAPSAASQGATGQVQVDIVFVHAVVLVGLECHLQVQIARLALAHARPALACQADALAGPHAAWNGELDRVFAQHHMALGVHGWASAA